MGLFDSIKSKLGKKEELKYEHEGPARVERRPEPEEKSDVGERWKTAKAWREDKAMDEPIIKRKRF